DYTDTTFWVRFDGGEWQQQTGNVSDGMLIDVPANQTSFELRFDTLDDDIYEGDENFTVWARVQGDEWNDTAGKGVVTITDNESSPTLESLTLVQHGREDASSY
ncbi:hypothetical protein CS022_24835, partial [Veronia nyctiphanis]